MTDGANDGACGGRRFVNVGRWRGGGETAGDVGMGEALSRKYIRGGSTNLRQVRDLTKAFYLLVL